MYMVASYVAVYLHLCACKQVSTWLCAGVSYLASFNYLVLVTYAYIARCSASYTYSYSCSYNICDLPIVKTSLVSGTSNSFTSMFYNICEEQHSK